MGGIYYTRWSCDNCDYGSSSVSGPYRVEPMIGTPKSKIEYRWCNNCKKIERVFTGEGSKIFLGNEPNSKIKSWCYQFKDLQELENAINQLEIKKKGNFFFFISKDNKKLKEYKALIPLYIESKLICEKISRENEEFYKNLKPRPRCLKCGSINVSNESWETDKHSCGGEFIRNESGRMGTVGEYEYVKYDKNGNSTSKMEKC